MTGRELNKKLIYIGMEKEIRRLALKDKLTNIECLAEMTIEEVCELIVKKYTVMCQEQERIVLVRTEDVKKYQDLVTVISR